ncbi:MAG: hypothetical protein HC831_12645 [Chloroflexia bacterium]|nr:hypothetical protein [Chloroflexia bacterium]
MNYISTLAAKWVKNGFAYRLRIKKERLNTQEETYKLLAQRLFSHFDSKKLVDWAVMMMECGYDSYSLIILAGLDKDSTEVREKYFRETIDELKLDVNKSDFDLIDYYANYIAESVVNKKIDPKDGLSIMQEIVRTTDYSSKYIQFYELDEDLDNLKYDNRTIFNSGLTLDNIDKFIITEFQLFLDVEKLKIERVSELTYCNTCCSIDRPKIKKKRTIIGRVEYKYWVCGNCGSKDILHFSDQKGREIIIKQNKKTQPNFK